MKKEIRIPDIAENVDSGVIGRILVSKGDQVKEDQPLVEVETDKAATDIPSPYTGTIEEIKVEEGDDVSVDQVIMIIEVKGDEDSGDQDAEAETDQDADQASGEEEDREQESGKDQAAGETDGEDEEEEPSGEDTEAEETVGQEDSDGKGKKVDKEGEGTGEEDDTEAGEGEGDKRKGKEKDESEPASGGRRAAADIPAAPSVRRMAREAGIDLSDVEGTGPGDRITAEDIASAKKTKESGSKQDETQQEPSGGASKKPAKDSKEASGLPDFSQWGATRKEKMNTVRRITARTMTESWQQIPQVTQFDEADITAIEDFRNKNKDAYEKQGGKLTVTAILLKIAAFAMQKFPRFNSSIDTSDNTLVMKEYINIGLAVDTDKGLIVPVIKDTDKKSLAEISVETVDLAKKARENEIKPEELQGGNFTISNLGGIGGTGFTPIVYAPQVAILGVSRASYKQVFREDRFQQRLVLPLTLTYDHRVIDGADGARFLRWICDVLEDPYALLQ